MKLDNVIATRKHKVIYRDGNLCYKVFDKSFSKADILNEALNQARVEETWLHIPKIHGVMPIEDGRWAIIYDYIEGKTLSQLMEENPEKKDKYLNDFVDLQISMHALKCPLLNKLRDKMKRKITETTLSATVKYELKMRLSGMPKHVKLCHGDFNPSNVILTADGTPYIIDWAHATQGNASADVARTYLMFCLSGDETLANKYLDLFCEKSDTPKQYVQKWMPIVAASQSVKGNEKEREFLYHWADVVEYE